MNVGWYVVYLLMIFLNSMTWLNSGFGIKTWQYWASFGMLVMCFIAGDCCYA